MNSRAWRFTMWLCLATAVALPAAARAQQTGSIAGNVTSKQTGQPIAGAQVFIRNTRHGQLTDALGRYTLQSVPAGTHYVIAQFIGFGEGHSATTVVRSGQSDLDQRVAHAASTHRQRHVQWPAAGHGRGRYAVDRVRPAHHDRRLRLADGCATV